MKNLNDPQNDFGSKINSRKHGSGRINEEEFCASEITSRREREGEKLKHKVELMDITLAGLHQINLNKRKSCSWIPSASVDGINLSKNTRLSKIILRYEKLMVMFLVEFLVCFHLFTTIQCLSIRRCKRLGGNNNHLSFCFGSFA